MFEREQREVRVRFRVPRKRWLVLVAFGMALAIGVPIAWATFSDVGPGNPFYADINAIQGAGITKGCGGGNFCPNDNITREAEAAFVHRGMPRVAQSTNTLHGVVPYSFDYPTDTVIASVSIAVGGVTGQTQFVKVDATMTNYRYSGTAPFALGYYIADGACTGPRSPLEYATVAASGDLTSSLSWTKSVPTGTTQTFLLCGFADTSGKSVGASAAVLDAMTVPFGSTGGSTLTAQKETSSSDRTPPHP